MASILDFEPLFQEDVASIRARIDADVNSGIPTNDPRWLDTREGTFFWDVTQPLVLEFARIYDALAVDVPAAAFASFAWGDYLDEHAAIFGLERKAAVAATGEVNFIGDPGSVVGEGVIVATETSDDGEAIEFATTESGMTGAQLDAPTGLAATPDTTGGTLAANTYRYSVTAYNGFGETLPSAQVTGVTTGSTGKNTLNWDDVVGADGYRVYRSLVAGDPGGLIYDGATSAFVDTGAVALGAAAPDLNGTSGVTLAVAAVEAGSAGTVGVMAITELESQVPGIDYVENLAATQGGTDTELDEQLRERVLLEYEGRGDGLINDYRRWALEEPGVGRVFVEPVWDGAGTVRVVIMTADGDPVAGTVVDSLQARLDPVVGTAEGIAPPGITVTVDTVTVRAIDFVATLSLEDGYSLDGGGGLVAVRPAVEAALASYVDDLDVGEDVIYHKAISQFFVAGVLDYTGSPTIEGGTANVAITNTPPEIAQLGTVTLS